VVFDMDGLLIDSEPLWVRAEREIFAEVGLSLTDEDCARTKGLRVDDVVRYWHQRRPWAGTSEAEVEGRLVARVAALVASEGAPLPGVASALEAARGGGRRLALASSSPMAIIDAALGRLGIASAFEVVASAEGEPLGKPHPAIFLTAAARRGVGATECCVVEDSLTGVIAGKAARMTTIAVPFDHPRHDPRFVIADAVVASLGEVTAGLFERLALS